MADRPGVSAGYRVLVAEDDAIFSAVLARTLLSRQCLVKSAAAVQEALDIAAAWQPQAAVVDLKLGMDSGLTLVPLLVRDCPGVRIVVLTGYASIATAVQAVKLGASDYLTKPAEVEDILAALLGSKRPALGDVSADPPSVRRMEWEHIQRVLTEQRGNISGAARVLGMHRRTLQRKLAKRPVKK